MASSTRGWLVFAAMLVGAFIIVQFTASTLESYETRSADQAKIEALRSN